MYQVFGQAPPLPPEGIPAPEGERPQPGTKNGPIAAASFLERLPPLYVALGVSAAASLALTALLWAVPRRKKKKKGAR